MEIIIHGATGRMGRMVASSAEAGFSNAHIAALVSPSSPESAAENCYTELTHYEGAADCVVDFSSHTATAALLEYCLQRNLPVVIATTGHTQEELATIVDAAKKIPVFFSANMSIGVALLADLAKKAAKAFPNADIEIVETHHNQKQDVPSGTALMLANAIRKEREEAEFVIGRHENGKRTKKEIGIHAIRLGNEVGTHEILISTGSETITLKHQAENRSLFAEGALTAAAFLCGQPAGFYSMKDIFGQGETA